MGGGGGGLLYNTLYNKHTKLKPVKGDTLNYCMHGIDIYTFI